MVGVSRNIERKGSFCCHDHSDKLYQCSKIHKCDKVHQYDGVHYCDRVQQYPEVKELENKVLNKSSSQLKCCFCASTEQVISCEKCPEELKYLCMNCNFIFHSHEDRRHHQVNEDVTNELEDPLRCSHDSDEPFDFHCSECNLLLCSSCDTRYHNHQERKHHLRTQTNKIEKDTMYSKTDFEKIIKDKSLEIEDLEKLCKKKEHEKNELQSKLSQKDWEVRELQIKLRQKESENDKLQYQLRNKEIALRSADESRLFKGLYRSRAVRF